MGARNDWRGISLLAMTLIFFGIIQVFLNIALAEIDEFRS
jgi:hypothetical protein